MAADDVGESAENVVEQGLQLQGVHLLGQCGKTPHVAEHHRELAAGRLHAVVFWLFDHFVHQLGGHVGAKQRGQLALGAAFHKVAINHVQREGRYRHHRHGCEGQRQPLCEIKPQVDAGEHCHHHRAEQ